MSESGLHKVEYHGKIYYVALVGPAFSEYDEMKYGTFEGMDQVDKENLIEGTLPNYEP